MADFSVRIPATPGRLNILETNCVEKKNLPPIKDFLFKPKTTDLKNYSPENICLRLREFPDKLSSLTEISTIKTEIGYSDFKKNLGIGKTSELINKAKQKDFEKWGELDTSSTEYKIQIDNENITVLLQEINPVGKFLKVEAPSQEALKKAVLFLSATRKDIISQNAAFLLAKKMGLI